MYKKLHQGSVNEAELIEIEYANSIDLLKRTIETRNKNNPFVFYEGPPSANGKPGLHHVIARALKDSVCRYKTMKNFQVKRKAGWDTHGLPVEIEVEKKLNLKNKKDIEEYGIKEFNQKCKESVFEYESIWREMTERMGYLVDMDNPYITLENDYIESVWWILSEFYKKEFMYEGFKILPYCSRCGTGLASHEVALGYKEITQDTVVVKFKRKDKDEYFLVWTTTPWTLASNVVLTVNPEVTYVRVLENDLTYIMAKDLLHKVMSEEASIIDEFKGSELEYVEYEPLMDFLKPDKKAYYVTLADYVTTEDGTGIVHTAPAFGEDDYNLARKYDAPMLKPVDEEGKYTDTPWKGKFVMDADLDIIKWLHSKDKLYSKQKMAHNYPHCWRCDTPLLYYAHPSWYIKMSALKDELVKNNNEVNWYPSHIGDKRFGNWLENIKDWAISRSRYWGTPLNIWKCDCGNEKSISSIEELKAQSINKLDKVELHRPYVDEVLIKCDKCSSSMKRVEYVVDVWFDSGAMPYAQMHYPFENKEEFLNNFPADYICEGIDQTRGWFYSLMAISTFIMGKSPYKNVLVNDMLLDKDGKKMSKRVGNLVDPFELFNQYGSDATRWYLCYGSPVWTPTKFDLSGLKEVSSKFFTTLKNIYNLFSLYANNDKIDASKIEDYKRSELDYWILSSYNKLVKEVESYYEEYDLTRVTRAIQQFVNEDFSNWYIRRSRRRFWKDINDDKLSAYKTTFDILVGVTKLSAPISPFITDTIFRNLTNKESVHLELFPTSDETLINEELEKRMQLAQKIVVLGRALRERANQKVRQPLSELILDKELENKLKGMVEIIKEELNVKNINYTSNYYEYINFEIKPNFRVLGPKLGRNINEFQKELNKLDHNKLYKDIKANKEVVLKDIVLNEENLDIRVSPKGNFAVETEDDLFVILDTNLSEDLKHEGYSRELISKIQQLRKTNDFDVVDRIYLKVSCDDYLKGAFKNNEEYIMSEVLALEIDYCENEGETIELNDKTVKVEIRK